MERKISRILKRDWTLESIIYWWGWSWRLDSNQRPADYKSAALPN